MRLLQQVVCALILLVPLAGHGKTLKYAVVIGNNQGQDPDRALRFAEQDASKFYHTLTELGGFQTGNTILLLGADAAAVSKTLFQMEQKIGAHAKDPSIKTLFIVYYSGHAEGDALELGDTALPMAEVLKHLRNSAADVRLAFMDSCRSGAMVGMKGGKKGAGFDILVTDEISSNGYAIITSSAESELSQESKEIRGAFFTHYLISAMRGAGDLSNDGKVTLSEAYDYAFRRTLARTSVTVGGPQHPMYEFRLEGQGDIVLTSTGTASSRLAVRMPESGRLMIVDEGRNIVTAEADLKVDETAQIALGPGSYSLYLVALDGTVRAASITLGAKESVVLDSLDFQPVELETGVGKGGLLRDDSGPVHTLLAAGVWRLFPLQGAVSTWGAAAAYRLRLPSGWQPTARITWTTRQDVGLSTGYNDVGFLIGVGYVLKVRKMDLHAELLGGYEHLFQSDYQGAARHTSGFDYLGMFGMSLPFDGWVFGVDAGVGGRTFQVQEKGWEHRLDFQAQVSIGRRWPQ